MKKYFNDKRDRFFENRLGLFVHWGIYSVGAWHEQHGYRANVPRDEYVRYAKEFNPTEFSPSAWLDLAEEMGADYICFTSKHIDGFCMFDTKYTDFNVMNTPYGRDILKELSEECHKRNFPLAIYYSPIDRNCPLYPSCGNSYENPSFYPEDTPDMAGYM
ncbi:MAG: alpha-L-fucosidase, partial [Clostridia bacterium]|nr:alpha-L-fucosidase [Clostridia bacterium]MBN2882613.1 alpha-L-fucosidase [Clostridia bacterium]